MTAFQPALGLANTTIDVVNGLPIVLGEAPKALPAPARMVDAEAVHRLAEGMTPQTWRHLRAELLALVTHAPPPGHFYPGDGNSP